MAIRDAHAQRDRRPRWGHRHRAQGFAAAAAIALSAGSALGGAGNAAAAIRPQSDVSVHLTGTSAALDGSTFRETVTVSNAGPASSSRVATAVLVPVGLIVTAAPGAAVNANPVQWTDRALKPGASVMHTVTFTVAANAHLTAFIGAVVVAAGSDPDPADNAAIAAIRLGAGPAGPCTSSGATVTCTYRPVGAEQTFTVPASVRSLAVVAIGAAGGSYEADAPFGAPGGSGTVVRATIPVTAGRTLFVEVGGPATTASTCGSNDEGLDPCIGGFNGGGSNPGSGFGMGGGGASDLRLVSARSARSLSTRVLVAAGGGGGWGEVDCDHGSRNWSGGGGDAGAAGGSGNSCTDSHWNSTGGGPGSQAAGGTGGYSSLPSAGQTGVGVPGTFGAGGSGLDEAGGGGGWFGGGSGGPELEANYYDSDLGGSGGGGGSSLVPAHGTVQLTNGAPSIEISFQQAPSR